MLLPDDLAKEPWKSGLKHDILINGNMGFA